MKKKFKDGGILSWNFLRQLFLIMKLTLFILITSVLSSLATGSYSQNAKVTLDLKSATVKETLKAIENSSEFFFVYNNELVNVDRKIDIQVKNEKIGDVLGKIFDGRNVEVTVIDRKIILAPTYMGSQQQGKKVTGKVTDSSGGSLPGVSVVVKGTTTGVITDNDGHFSLANLPDNATLQFSFVGMKMQEVIIGGKTNIDVKLEEDAIGIEEVVAVGYGNKSVRKVLTSVSKVDTEKLNNASYSNMGQALSGISPGLILKQSGGGPGGDVPSISIRGGGDPLYVIDGVTSNKTDFARLSPNDIGNISVLKDAGAAAIYGARAANGVILIETKKAQGNSVSYSSMFSYASLAQKNEPLSSYDYATFNNKIASMYGLAVLPWSADAINKFKDGSDPVNYPNTNWMDLTVGVAPSQKHNLSVSGTEKSIKYLFSLSVQEQNSMYKDPSVFKLQNYSVLSKITKDFGKSGLKFDFTFRGSM